MHVGEFILKHVVGYRDFFIFQPYAVKKNPCKFIRGLSMQESFLRAYSSVLKRLKCLFPFLGAYIYPQRIIHSLPSLYLLLCVCVGFFLCECVSQCEVSVAWMICNPSGSRGLHDPSSSGHRESRRGKRGRQKLACRASRGQRYAPLLPLGCILMSDWHSSRHPQKIDEKEKRINK